MASVPASQQRASRFFPKADAAVRSYKPEPVPARPKTVHPIFDKKNFYKPLLPLTAEAEATFYPTKKDPYQISPVPNHDLAAVLPDPYLRAFLAKNERLRLSMLWYYTRDLLVETEFLAGLQEKLALAQETTAWEYVVIGLLDVNFYVRLATIGLPLGILPRGETICAHTVTQPPGSLFLMPNIMDDWRFRQCPYVESGGLRAYVGAPLRLQSETGDVVGLGSLCVASGAPQPPLTEAQQKSLVRVADWIVSDIIHCARARRQRDRRRMSDYVAAAQREMEGSEDDAPILDVLREMYPSCMIRVETLKGGRIQIDDQTSLSPFDFEDGLWEHVDYIDDFIKNANNEHFPQDKVVRSISIQCESVSGPAWVVVASKDFQHVFDDVDTWFVHTCATMLSQMSHKRLLAEAMKAKEKFLRGFSHQLRTPIHGILSSVELLAEELARSPRSGESDFSPSTLIEAASVANSITPSVYLDIIKTAGRDLIVIVNNMITLNRWTDIAATPRDYENHSIFDLEVKLSSELRLVRSQASIIFLYDIPQDCHRLRTDLGLLRDSLLPLIVNALQNTSEGIISVTVSALPDSSRLIVDVRDRGCGIHPDHHQLIFEPYEKVSMDTMGVGLGLTVASKFATLLRGSVVLVSSEIGRGSHFRATFDDVEYISSPPYVAPHLATHLSGLPSKFFISPSSSEASSISTHFAGHLQRHAFTPSSSPDGSLFIFDHAQSPGAHRDELEQIPSSQVAICLVGAGVSDAVFEETSHVLYVIEPFLSSTMDAALIEADMLASQLKFPESSALALGKVGRSHSDETLVDEDTRLSPLPGQMAVSTTQQVPPAAEAATAGLNNLGLTSPEPALVVREPKPPKSSSPAASLPTFKDVPRPTALLVDDNAINLRILQMYCRKRKLPYLCAADGRQAIEIFKKHQLEALADPETAPIQLVLMDLQMPVCDGIEATRTIRQLEAENCWERSVLFIITGQDGPTDRIAADEVGVDDFHVKPVGIEVLDKGVKRYFPAFLDNA